MTRTVVAAVMAALLLSLPACGGERPPVRLTLADLARFTQQYDGERVSTAGIVRSHPAPEHYWIEDDALNRVAIEPHAAVAGRVGERVRVVGRFRHSTRAGRSIEVESVTAAER